jgi:hypothetical protein
LDREPFVIEAAGAPFVVAGGTNRAAFEQSDRRRDPEIADIGNRPQSSLQQGCT